MSGAFGDPAGQRVLAIRKIVAQLLESKYAPYDEILQRAMHHLVTEADMVTFAKMIAEVYEAGYMKAVIDYRVQLDKIGIKVSVNQKNLAGSRKDSQ